MDIILIKAILIDIILLGIVRISLEHEGPQWLEYVKFYTALTILIPIPILLIALIWIA